MKRGQLVERNRGQRGFEVQHPIAPAELGTVEQSAMPSNFGVTTRKLRFTRSSSRDYSAEISILEGTYSRECPNDSQADNGGAVGTSDRVLRSSQSRVSSSVLSAKEGPKSVLEIYKDHISEIVASSRSGVDESGQDCLSPELRKVTSGTDTDTEKPQRGLGKDDRGKENVDPHGDCGGTSSGSPLPEWFTRKPLQDITNVLAAGLGDDQHPQPKKKLKKKVGAAAAPSFPSLSETPTRRKDSTISQPKCSSFATPKQFSNLGKNFR